MIEFKLGRRQLIATGGATVLFAQTRAFAAPLIVRDHITVEVFGEGPDIVFMPGYACARDVWRSMAERLSSAHRVHLLQVRGFAGLAPPIMPGPVWDPVVADVAAYLRTLQDPAFVGHSMGGATGLRLVIEHPGAVSKLLVADSLPFYTALINPSMTAEQARPFAAQTSAAILAAPPAQFEAMQAHSASILSKSTAARERIVAWSVASDRATIATAIGELISTDLRASLPRIDVPTTIAFAWDAAMGRPAEVHEAFWRSQYEGLREARFARVDESFHFVMDDQPERCAAIIRSFLGVA